ncbi:MAG TPA: hypothetical protein VIJ10_03815 [Vicinamibacteria bacterium]
MSPTARLVLVVVIVAALARGALHVVSFGLPVSNDDAILLLMARALLHGELATTLWNQPYNGALDAYLLAPLLAVLPHHAAYRLYQALGAVLLVLLVFRLARRLGGSAAGWAGAVAAAFGAPYMALMAATGPPPNFLMPLVTGFPLLVGMDAAAGAVPSRRRLFLAGVVCGLAIWNSSLAIPAFAGMALGLWLAGLRPRAGSAAVFGAGVALGALPLVVSRLVGAAGTSVVTASSAVTTLRPRWLWGEGLAHLAGALVGLVGLQVPLVVDGVERASLPVALAALLALGLLVAVAAALRTRLVWPLLGWAGALAGAFWLSRRTGPDDLRYLYGLYPPLLALAGSGLAALWARRRAVAVAAALAVALAWGYGEWLLVRAWSNPDHAERVWQVPSLAPARAALETAGARSAYASLQFAGRLALETGGTVVASQAWNERIPGDPLRFRDEVDLDPSPCWVLSHRLSRGMPRAAGFREIVRGLGGSFEETEAGSMTVFHGFRPPYDESRPVLPEAIRVSTGDGAALGSEALDRDPATAWTAAAGLSRGSGLVVRVAPARRLSALVLAVDLETSPLAVPWAASVGGEVVAEGPARSGFQWVNGAPRAGRQALLVVPLGEREADEVRLVFQGPGPRLAVAEVFLYGPGEAALAHAGLASARDAFESARAGRWDEAVRLYAQALRLEPQRASHHAAWARARWRAAQRRVLDVESLTDGGSELVEVR